MSNNCPVCRSNNFKVIGIPKPNSIAKNFLRKEYKVVKCIECGSYYVHPLIDFSDKEWSELYNSEYFSAQTNWLINRRAKELFQRFEKAESYFKRNEEVNFLDIGCGEGRTLIEGLRRGWNVTGIDIVDNRIPEARTEKINFASGKFLELELPENFYDFVYLDSVLEHVLQPVEYLNKIRNILKPNGILYIGVPNEDSLFNVVRKTMFILSGKGSVAEKLKPFDSPYHVVGFNHSSLNYIISKAGFKIKLLRNFGRKFDFLSNPINTKAFWVSLIFLLPIELIGYLLKKDVYFEAYLSK
ncbi:SAM-dependent methyltransferase [Ignavibacterium album JCM 16511]|uniref:SAM-dependent methyltransferase n=1 Tax=Ignavibacterium album (strain DSM 19864 / JCM 16511 / NBRC 101810 / Mat9-16) TaxID=945713 RepID=I0ANY3_IGNAJ|nr:class I SAM-dependent methyltransferase [Ignavibacterium album]AFH50690.1 SAM-dependent methyltransferase [Ignavibacterium album JCM 16511]